MKSLDTVQRPLSLAERAAAALGRPAPPEPEKVCLLLDVSGSMGEEAEPGRTKIDALREIVRGLNAPQIYAFSRVCRKVAREDIPDPSGGTALHVAFAKIKSHRIARAVLITDGIPDDEDAAIREAAGLSLEIFYVGPAPKPPFLDRLTRAAKQGSAAHMESLRSDGKKALSAKVQLMLEG
jgi:hypothetical protein